jgi:hypothetical protein
MNLPPANVHFHFETLNLCFGTQVTAAGREHGKDAQVSPFPFFPLFINPNPAAGTQQPTRTTSSSALGSICAQVNYNTPFPDEVRALVYPVLLFPDSPPDMPPTNAVPGTRASGGAKFTWTEGNDVPGTDHTPSAAPLNRLAVWRRDGTTWKYDSFVQFLGKTGTAGHCGTGTGSGPNLVAVGTVYPAQWALSGAGFREPPLRVFNASWLLRQRAGAGFTWDNGGDAENAPGVRLEASPEGWKLQLRYRKVDLVYSLAAGGSTFGPLRFPSHRAEVVELGRVELPPLDVAAV